MTRRPLPLSILVTVALSIGLVAPSIAHAEKGETYIGLSGHLLPWGKLETGDSQYGDHTIEVTYGFGIHGEHALLGFFALGATVELLFPSWSGEVGRELVLDPHVRLFYPGESWEPYVKGEIGGSFLWPPKEPYRSEFAAGWNWSAALGSVFRWTHVGIFAEAGYGQLHGETRYETLSEKRKIRLDAHRVFLDLGVVVVF